MNNEPFRWYVLTCNELKMVYYSLLSAMSGVLIWLAQRLHAHMRNVLNTMKE